MAAFADAMQLLGHGLPLSHWAGHVADKATNEMGELGVAIPLKLINGSTPAADHFGSRGAHPSTALLGRKSTSGEVSRNPLGALSHVCGFSPQHRAIDPVHLLSLDLATNGALRSVGWDALLSQMAGKLLAPVTKGSLLDVEANTLLADGFEDDVDVGVGLVSMENEA